MSDLVALVAFIDEACARAGTGAEAASDLRLATEEVFTNIIRHGYRDRPGPVTVRVEVAPGQLTVTLSDVAPAFDPATVVETDVDADWAERRLGGLGWHLVHRVMDEVAHTPDGQGGNVFTLVKRFSGRLPGISES